MSSHKIFFETAPKYSRIGGSRKMKIPTGAARPLHILLAKQDSAANRPLLFSAQACQVKPVAVGGGPYAGFGFEDKSRVPIQKMGYLVFVFTA